MAYAPKKPDTSNNKRGRIPGGVGKKLAKAPKKDGRTKMKFPQQSNNYKMGK